MYSTLLLEIFQLLVLIRRSAPSSCFPGKRRRNEFVPVLLSQQMNMSFLVCSGWFHFALAQGLGLCPALLGRPFVCDLCRVFCYRVHGTVSVVIGSAWLAAAVGVVVWNWGRSFPLWLRGTIGPDALRFDWVDRNQLRRIYWVVCNTCQDKKKRQKKAFLQGRTKTTNNSSDFISTGFTSNKKIWRHFGSDFFFF